MDHCFADPWWKTVYKREAHILSAHSTVRRQCSWEEGGEGSLRRSQPLTSHTKAGVRQKEVNPQGLFFLVVADDVWSLGF